jgi:hypothetical protein
MPRYLDVSSSEQASGAHRRCLTLAAEPILVYAQERMEIGRHTYAFEPPDILHCAVRGHMSLAEAREAFSFMQRYSDGLPYVFLVVDATGFGGFSSEARQFGVQACRSIRYRGMAIYGATYSTAIIMKLLVTALNLFTGRDNPVAFFEKEADVHTWLLARRALLACNET